MTVRFLYLFAVRSNGALHTYVYCYRIIVGLLYKGLAIMNYECFPELWNVFLILIYRTAFLNLMSKFYWTMLIWIDAHGLSYSMHCFHYHIVRYFEDLAAYCIVLYLVDWTKSAQREIFSAAPATAIGKIQSTVPPMRKVNMSFGNMDYQNIVKFACP
ncbi:hypothetical protein ACQJBY_042967 [Aegilops geniculata]